MNDIESELDIQFERALYDESAFMRDQARQQIARHATKRTVLELIALLDANHRVTRRRAERVIAEIHPSKTQRYLRQAVESSDAPIRIRKAMARILTSQADGDEPVLATGLRDPSTRVRRACATAAAPTTSLVEALFDDDDTVVDNAVYALTVRQDEPDHTIIEAAIVDRAEPLVSLIRLLARISPTSSVLSTLGDKGLRAAQDYCTDEDSLIRLARSEPVSAAWRLAKLRTLDEQAFRHTDPRIRTAAVRSAPSDDARVRQALHDDDAGVRWMATQVMEGKFSAQSLVDRHAPPAGEPSPSLSPPYGLRAGDKLPKINRSHAALAMCQSRFNINLGVAIRSAEAAGLQEVFFVGRSDFMRSPARGADLAIPVVGVEDVAALIRIARLQDYQIVAIQQTGASVPYHRAQYPPRPLFVMGAEDAGMPRALLEAADLVVEIPQFGIIDSLNVATASTVVLFHWRVHCESS